MIKILICLALFGSLLLNENVWAGGTSTTGGTSSGSGSVPTCSSAYSGIHQPSCGENGGGRSWRIYRVRGRKLSQMNAQADWKIDDGEYGGSIITGKNGLLARCKAMLAPYVLLHGLNRVVVSGAEKKFYVALSRVEPKGDCSKNRGCYYVKNEANAISNEATILAEKWKDGKNVTYKLAKALYEAEPDLTADYKTVGGFCTWGTVEKFTLTAYAKEYGGGFLNNSVKIDDDAYAAGGDAEVDNVGDEYKGYTWYKWDIGGSICANWTSRECSHSNMPAKDTTVYAYYLRDKFEGKTSVSGASSETTGWASANTAKVAHLSNCLEGCTVSFNHQMKRTQGAGASSYSIARKTNIPLVTSGTVANPTTFNASGETDVRNSESYTLRPGHFVCETMTFYPQTVSGASTVYTQVCVIADVPGSTDSFIDARVRDQQSAEKYHDWQDEVYGKPGDIIDYKSWYTPAVQIVANAVVDKIAGTAVTSTTLKNYNNWNNGYNVTGKLPYSIQGAIGSTETLQGSNIGENNEDISCEDVVNPHVCHGHKVQVGEVGTAASQTARTNDLIKNVPYSVTFSIEGGANPLLVATIDWAPRLKTVKANIPYNFINTTNVVKVNDDDVLYTGEVASFEIQVDVKTKENNETNGTYATRVPNAKRKLGMSVGRGGDYVWREETFNDTFNSSGKMDGSTEIRKNMTIPIPDLEAGTEVCIKSAIYPKDSGPDDNMKNNYYDVNDLSNWSISQEKCYRVAKKPSIQVWGGNVYSGSAIKTALGKKVHLTGYGNDYNVNMTNDQPYLFGSWSELGVISVGKITGFASAAGLGYTSNSGRMDVWPPVSGVNPPSAQGSPGGYSGTQQSYFCQLSLLSIANSECNAGSAGNVGTGNAINGIKNDQTKIRDLATVLNVGEPEDASTINIDGNTTYYESNKITINGGNVPKNKTILVHATQDITINGDITYENADYNSILESPKLIIYASNNINISCRVGRIDAVLMGNVVDTCSDSEDINSEANSRQLTIYGAVLANRLEAKRTYGAAAGVNSMVPAEIIDFDPTLYLWNALNDTDSEGAESEEENKDSSVDVVYTKELAPRF